MIEIRTMKSFFGLREPLSGLSHFAGLLLSLAGSLWLVCSAARGHDLWHVLAFMIYGISLILLYLSSTLYHCLKVKRVTIIWLKRVDHMMIFVLIAGTYTPLCLVALGGVTGWKIFAAVWTVAICGIVGKIFWLSMPRWMNVGIYVVMGWFGVFLLPKLALVMSQASLIWLASGGIIYTVGAVIYAFKWPNIRLHIWEFHETWHLFVMGGSACHFIAIKSLL